MFAPHDVEDAHDLSFDSIEHSDDRGDHDLTSPRTGLLGDQAPRRGEFSKTAYALLDFERQLGRRLRVIQGDETQDFIKLFSGRNGKANDYFRHFARSAFTSSQEAVRPSAKSFSPCSIPFRISARRVNAS